MSKKCTPKCPYFPNIVVTQKDWVYDEKLGYKTLIKEKKLCCNFDGEPIDGERKCPWKKRDQIE